MGARFHKSFKLLLQNLNICKYCKSWSRYLSSLTSTMVMVQFKCLWSCLKLGLQVLLITTRRALASLEKIFPGTRLVWSTPRVHCNGFYKAQAVTKRSQRLENLIKRSLRLLSIPNTFILLQWTQNLIFIHITYLTSTSLYSAYLPT